MVRRTICIYSIACCSTLYGVLSQKTYCDITNSKEYKHNQYYKIQTSTQKVSKNDVQNITQQLVPIRTKY